MAARGDDNAIDVSNRGVMTANGSSVPAGLDIRGATRPETQAAIGTARQALDRLALDRLAFEIRTWWAHNRQLYGLVSLELAKRTEERRGEVR